MVATSVRAVGLAVAAALTSALLSVTSAGAADLHGDDESDRYVGTGGLVLPPTVDEHTRTAVALCGGCEWRLSSPCIRPVDGNPFSGQPTCLSVVRGCPNQAELLRAWFRESGQPWREVALVCIGPGGPVTVAAAGHEVHDRLVRLLPPPAPRRQPHRGAVVQLPVVFSSGQGAEGVHDDWAIAGTAVTLDARPRWRWEFGDGRSLVTSDPGGSYPAMTVWHTYRVAGEFAVRVQTSWTAEFTVAGLGPFPVPEAVTQDARLRVPVGEGRAVLAVRGAPWRN